MLYDLHEPRGLPLPVFTMKLLPPCPVNFLVLAVVVKLSTSCCLREASTSLSGKLSGSCCGR